MRYGDEVNFGVPGSSFPKLIESLLGDWMKDVLTVFESFRNSESMETKTYTGSRSASER
jgi:hypothetical protein